MKGNIALLTVALCIACQDKNAFGPTQKETPAPPPPPHMTDSNSNDKSEFIEANDVRKEETVAPVKVATISHVTEAKDIGGGGTTIASTIGSDGKVTQVSPIGGPNAVTTIAPQNWQPSGTINSTAVDSKNCGNAGIMATNNVCVSPVGIYEWQSGDKFVYTSVGPDCAASSDRCSGLALGSYRVSSQPVFRLFPYSKELADTPLADFDILSICHLSDGASYRLASSDPFTNTLCRMKEIYLVLSAPTGKSFDKQIVQSGEGSRIRFGVAGSIAGESIFWAR